MAQRLKATLLDYMVVAINPALIMLLIGSLVYFLLEMLYQGQYPERLHFCLTMFIFGAVLVARISMESGLERAAPFGIILALLMCVAMLRFVEYHGSNLEQVGWIINYALVALILWCAYKLTWDCTLIDDMQDASGEGLLQTARLDSTGAKPAVAKPTDAPSGNKNELPNSTSRRAKKDRSEIPTTDILPLEQAPTKRLSWWQRFLERRRRPHAPGIWIVYFSLAALPIFGLGQVFIPVENAGSRRYAFGLLCVYVACGLGLLLTTSFLGLRRYLRQRRLEMPVAMAGTWLTTGAVLIVAILIFTALVPRPNAEYSISRLPWEATSSEHDASKFAVGHEGTIDQQANGGSGTRKSLDGNDQDLKPGGVQTVDHPSTGSGESSAEKSSSQPSSSPTNQPSTQNSKQASDRQSQGSKDSAKGGTQQADGKASGGAEQSQSRDTTKNEQSAKNEAKNLSSRQQQGEQSAQQPNAASPENPPSQAPPPDVTQAFAGISNALLSIFKIVFYVALVLLAAWWLWRHPEMLSAWIQSLISGWRCFWNKLFGGKRREPTLAAATAKPHRSFLDFNNPFASGMAGQASAVELVRYSFEALEAGRTITIYLGKRNRRRWNSRGNLASGHRICERQHTRWPRCIASRPIRRHSCRPEASNI